MIPFLFIALALAAGLAAYETLPRAHAWLDEHVQALRNAFTAHRTADTHLAAAKSAPDPVTVVQHVHAATVANRGAAQETATAAKTARTEQQRVDAVQSADRVVERENEIAGTLAAIGVGQCDVRTYSRVTSLVRDGLLAKLHGAGMTVTGDNPWDIDTHDHDVKLRAIWDPVAQVLKLLVTSGKGGYFGLVTCATIWAKIDPIVKEIIGP